MSIDEPNLFGEMTVDRHGSLLADEFMLPPFSVLSARDGWWQERKRKWLALGIQSELGRGDAVPGGAGQTAIYRAGSGAAYD